MRVFLPLFFCSGFWVRSGVWGGAFVRFASVFRSFLLLFRLFLHFFVFGLSFFLDFVLWFWFCAYFCGVGVITTETSPRRWETSVDRNVGCCNFMEFVVYIIPKTTGVGFSKRWVSRPETTRILFEGAHPSFFVAFCCFVFGVPRFRFVAVWFFFVWFLLFFLVLFGGFDFVRTFAARNSVWSSAPGCILGSVAPFAISFFTCLIKSCASEMLCSTKSPQSYSLTII